MFIMPFSAIHTVEVKRELKNASQGTMLMSSRQEHGGVWGDLISKFITVPNWQFLEMLRLQASGEGVKTIFWGGSYSRRLRLWMEDDIS